MTISSFLFPFTAIPSPYDDIVVRHFTKFLSQGIDDDALSNYFDACFDDVVEHFHLWPCWVCVGCARRGNVAFGWGASAAACPNCGQQTVYEVGTFQARAARIGEAFEWAFYYLLLKGFNFHLQPTPNARIYDFQVTTQKVVETKGSAAYVDCPDGRRHDLGRPGLMRSDTEKKAFANAKAYRSRNPNGLFCIVSNAVPEHLIGYANRDINAIYDATKEADLRTLVEALKDP